ncbi:hypothetical protein [Herpetosiphon sp. NSE202]|uniref:hypothetical protein n=1 Tax=Herpetosiphon sp. NSE202 TaxID=3351349 RepID=UPI00363D7DF8
MNPLAINPPIMTSGTINQTVSANAGVAATKPCPYCAEQILVDAKKCRFCNEWLSSSTNPAPMGITQTYAPQKTQKFLAMELSTRVMMITGFILFFLFFSPFVSCGPIEMSAGTVAFASVADVADNRNNNDEGSIIWLSLILVPITAATLFVTGMSMAQELAANITHPQKPERTQILVIITSFIVAGLGILITFHPIIELLWGYYAIMGCLATAFW